MSQASRGWQWHGQSGQYYFYDSQRDEIVFQDGRRVPAPPGQGSQPAHHAPSPTPRMTGPVTADSQRSARPPSELEYSYSHAREARGAATQYTSHSSRWSSENERPSLPGYLSPFVDSRGIPPSTQRSTYQDRDSSDRPQQHPQPRTSTSSLNDQVAAQSQSIQQSPVRSDDTR